MLQHQLFVDGGVMVDSEVDAAIEVEGVEEDGMCIRRLCPKIASEVAGPRRKAIKRL